MSDSELLYDIFEVATKKYDLVSNRQDQFMDAFNDGDAEMFFALWEDHASSFRGDAKNLEILVSVYFAIYPILSQQPGLTEVSMDRFKKFLEQRGEWAQEPEFLQYYALPYLPEPRTHPSFRVLFESPWLDKLKQELDVFLSQLAVSRTPRLMELLEKGSRPAESEPIERPSSQLGNEIVELKRSIKDSTKREHDLATKLQNLRTDYHQLLTVSGELVTTLMSAINQEKIEPAYLADIVKRLTTLKKPANPAADESQAVQKTPVPPGPSPNKLSVHKPNIKTKSPSAILKLVDFARLQSELMKPVLDTDQERRHCNLIASFRAFLTSANSIAKRREILEYMIDQDFLGMNEVTLLPYLLRHTSPLIREQCAKMINSVSTDCVGRAYLLRHDGLIVQDVVQAMKLDPQDTICRQNLLGTLQKLSLRYACFSHGSRLAQSMMNKAQMITYLSTILSDLESLSEYSVEYGSALFMNLCLRTQGKIEACANPDVTIRILNDLIDHDNVQVKTYVNGCLYSLFADRAMREKAQSIGMESQLQYLKQLADDSLARQIDFVIEKLVHEEEEEEEDEESEDGEEDDDNENDEEDTLDMTEEGRTELPDEQLLKPFFFKSESKGGSPPKKGSIARAAETRHSPDLSLTSAQLQSMQIQLPVLESTKKGKLNLPISKEE
ncbi:LisH domain-containing protein armc9 [Kappamyces sp. JEL0680]|nr:LisH domain-containing protein armc9 [Kappamyces sp. JEL0680]